MSIELILLQLIVVFIVDLSGFVQTVKFWIWKKYIGIGSVDSFNFKPWECSFCMTHHVGLIYLLVTCQFTLPHYVFLLLLCYFTPLSGELITLARDSLNKLINILFKYLV